MISALKCDRCSNQIPINASHVNIALAAARCYAAGHKVALSNHLQPAWTSIATLTWKLLPDHVREREEARLQGQSSSG